MKWVKRCACRCHHPHRPNSGTLSGKMAVVPLRNRTDMQHAAFTQASKVGLIKSSSTVTAHSQLTTLWVATADESPRIAL
jgi:hypothetical protein